MIEPKQIIRYANHVTAVTEPLRGKSGATLFCRRALKSAQTLFAAAKDVQSAERKVQKRALDSVLSEYHRLEYVLDTLYAGKNIGENDYARLIDEGKDFRNNVLLSICETRRTE